jgi:hypothetical protein
MSKPKIRKTPYYWIPPWENRGNITTSTSLLANGVAGCSHSLHRGDRNHRQHIIHGKHAPSELPHSGARMQVEKPPPRSPQMEMLLGMPLAVSPSASPLWSEVLG